MDKKKIGVSLFVDLIIENDACNFGFIKKDGYPNKNGFLNKIIPNILTLRKVKREKIRRTLADMGRENAEEIYEAVNQIIDEVYFDNEDIHTLDTNICLLPTRETATIFDEICENETVITAQTPTECIRGLLNEYALLPQYKRETVAFSTEIDMIFDACTTGKTLHFDFKGDKFKFFPFQHMYGFLYNQSNYLIGYDINRKQIRSFPIVLIRRLFVLKGKYHPNPNLVEKLQDYLNRYNYGEENIVDFGDENEEER